MTLIIERSCEQICFIFLSRDLQKFKMIIFYTLSNFMLLNFNAFWFRRVVSSSNRYSSGIITIKQRDCWTKPERFELVSQDDVLGSCMSEGDVFCFYSRLRNRWLLLWKSCDSDEYVRGGLPFIFVTCKVSVAIDPNYSDFGLKAHRPNWCTANAMSNLVVMQRYIRAPMMPWNSCFKLKLTSFFL